MSSKMGTKEKKSDKTIKNKEDADVKKVDKSVINSDSESDSESEVDSDDESEEEPENEEESNKKTDKKEKTPKPTFEELFADVNKLNEEEIKICKEITELENQVSQKLKLTNNIKKQRAKLLSLFPKAYADGMNQARKEKKKRTNSAKSGILREDPVPPILIKFLGLADNTHLPRPKVFHLLNNKFKELGLKNGQVTTLDKKTAKIFNVDEGHKIEFKDCQTFLANIYKSFNDKSNEVVL